MCPNDRMSSVCTGRWRAPGGGTEPLRPDLSVGAPGVAFAGLGAAEAGLARPEQGASLVDEGHVGRRPLDVVEPGAPGPVQRRLLRIGEDAAAGGGQERPGPEEVVRRARGGRGAATCGSARRRCRAVGGSGERCPPGPTHSRRPPRSPDRARPRRRRAARSRRSISPPGTNPVHSSACSRNCPVLLGEQRSDLLLDEASPGIVGARPTARPSLTIRLESSTSRRRTVDPKGARTSARSRRSRSRTARWMTRAIRASPFSWATPGGRCPSPAPRTRVPRPSTA